MEDNSIEQSELSDFCIEPYEIGESVYNEMHGVLINPVMF